MSEARTYSKTMDGGVDSVWGPYKSQVMPNESVNKATTANVEYFSVGQGARKYKNHYISSLENTKQISYVVTNLDEGIYTNYGTNGANL